MEKRFEERRRRCDAEMRGTGDRIGAAIFTLALIALSFCFSSPSVAGKSRRPFTLMMIQDNEVRQKKNRCYADIESWKKAKRISYEVKSTITVCTGFLLVSHWRASGDRLTIEGLITMNSQKIMKAQIPGSKFATVRSAACPIWRTATKDRRLEIAGYRQALHPVGNPNTFSFGVMLSGVFYHLYNQSSYQALDEISPLTFSVGNTVKRVVVIVSIILVFRNPVRPLNALGSAIAIFVTFLYSQATSKKIAPSSSSNKKKSS